MSLCACPDRPRCEAYNGMCNGQAADWTVLIPAFWKPPLRLRAQFFCNECFERFKTAWKTHMKGIDRPANADEDWRGSIMDHLRHAQISIAFEERKERERLHGARQEYGPLPLFAKHYTPPQMQSFLALRKGLRELRAAQRGGEA